MKPGRRTRFRVGLTWAVVVLGFAAAGVSLFSQEPESAVWGGEHVRLEMTKNGAKLEFDCAHGASSEALSPDAQGNFKASGTYTREHGGPARKDESQNVPATYTGSIQGSTMRLTIVLVSSKETLGPYELVRGETGRVYKCR